MLVSQAIGKSPRIVWLRVYEMCRTVRLMDGKQIYGCLGRRGMGETGADSNGWAISFGDDENILKPDYGDS